MRPPLHRSRAICADATEPSPNPSKLPRTHTVAFENWSQRNTDVLRLKRLLMGGGLSALALAGGMTYLVLTSKAAAEEQEEEEKVVEVQLAKEPEPEPEPPPPPPPELKPQRSNPGPRLQKIEVPTTITDEKLQEKDVKPTTGGGDPYEKGGGDGTSGPKEAVVEAPTPPPPPPAPVLPKVKKPVPVSEGMTPPEPVVKLVKPEYPADAKAAGLEGTVVVRYVVNEQGDVTDVRAMKGPPELHAVCVAAVKAMRFKPALDADGKPVMVVRYMKFPFKLRT
jgi:periplasmic protein TonB